MPTYNVTAAITGTAWCSVEAGSAEDAIEKARNEGEWELDNWDLSTAPYNGGFIEAQEEA